MSCFIQGMGWVTPLGTGLDGVWECIQSGGCAPVDEVSSQHSVHLHRCISVPPALVAALERNPRLRRSSPISYYTAAAGLAALENAGIVMTPEIAARTAVVFAIASGGVVYTRKFYAPVVLQGANAASPLLFPETVYNAPASHLSALLGINGMSYTLVGDASVGIAALDLARSLLDTGEIDRCLVVGGEETDWVLCEAYRSWRLPMILAGGAAALVLGRNGGHRLDPVHGGVPFFNRKGAGEAIRSVCRDLAQSGRIDLVVSGANGSWMDSLESRALATFFPGTPLEFPKRALGEALGAGALMQTVYGVLALEKRGLERVLVSVPGLNHQAAGLVICNGQTEPENRS